MCVEIMAILTNGGCVEELEVGESLKKYRKIEIKNFAFINIIDN